MADGFTTDNLEVAATFAALAMTRDVSARLGDEADEAYAKRVGESFAIIYSAIHNSQRAH